jgi:hypothetical protein
VGGLSPQRHDRARQQEQRDRDDRGVGATADTATVPTSARCTVAEATAGAEPIASSSVVEDTP